MDSRFELEPMSLIKCTNKTLDKPLQDGGEWRRLGIDVEWSVKTCNDIRDFTRNDLNFDYYLQEAKKLIEGVS